ncbi:lysine-specific demethylase 3A isoform X2 [Uranotaenia lowii]|uniref:lysine-specific demethylase 3A isoform X2 n=1 Tax=Uranotaenia lowii TaxID=190385 RepID=UPI00247A1CDE|nr:lysine-specific demethylase 3A isoform X2 [Uranotaenia lowii]
MSTNPKMHQDLQKQMLKLQYSNMEPPATTIHKPAHLQPGRVQQPNSGTIPRPPAPPVKPRVEKKTFEQAYREAIERINAAATQNNAPRNQPSKQLHRSSGVSSKASDRTGMTAVANLTGPSQNAALKSPTANQGEYKTTIYNINTINLAELLKNQRSPSYDFNPARGLIFSAEALPTTSNSNVQSNPVTSQLPDTRLLEEKFKYHQTYANAYANHLLQLTKNAVEQKAASNAYRQQFDQSTGASRSVVVGASQSPVGLANHATSPKMNQSHSSFGKGQASNAKQKIQIPTYASVASSSSNQKRNVLIKLDRSVGNTPESSKLPSLETMMAANANQSRLHTTSIGSVPVKSNTISPTVNNEGLNIHVQSQTSGSNSPLLFVTPPRSISLVEVPSSTSTPLPNIGYRPDIPIVTKPKVTTPAPLHVYGKPNIVSTIENITSIEPPSGNKTPKLQSNQNATYKFNEPPPAHSKSPMPQVPLNTATATISKPMINMDQSSSCNEILNLDTKSPTPQHTNKNASSGNTELQSSSNHCTSGDRATSLYNLQKLVKIQKPVNYTTGNSKQNLSLESSAVKFQQNVLWKEQQLVKQENTNGSNDSINDQKMKLLELLQNANLPKACSQSKVTQPTMASASTGATHQNKPNMELYKYRIPNAGSSHPTKLIDPLAIKQEKSNNTLKRKDPAKRIDSSKIKRPKRSTVPQLQKRPCYEVAPRLPKCRECGRSAAARSRDAENIFCRFIAFRKLRYNDQGFLEVAGFADPNNDPSETDFSLWNANLSKIPIDLSVEKSKFLLGQVGYKFCELFHQEKEAYFEHMSADKTIAWKQAVWGVREMCDVCSTTLFNYHWVCSTCGFVVCIDCYKGRKHGACRNDTGTKDRDGYMWLHCTNKDPHDQEKLMLTQIIPSNGLYKLVRQMHGICALLEIPLNCECPLSKEPLFRKVKDKLEFIYPITFEVDKCEKKSIVDNEIKQTDDETSTSTKMISISVKQIESKRSEDDKETICCKVIFGRELSENKNPETEMLQRKEKQSYSFEGFQEDIKIESVEDFTHKDVSDENDENISKDMNDSEEDKKPCLQENNEKSEQKSEELNAQPDCDPLELSSGSKSDKVSTEIKKMSENESYNEEHRFKESPKLDWKTFNMIAKQLLKFDKSINISGLFEKHLDEKCTESDFLVDFTAEIKINNENLQNFLKDFLSEFVFLTGQNNSDNLTDEVQILEYNKYMKKCIEFQNKGERIMNLSDSQILYPKVAHQWLCNGRLLRLLDPLSDENYTAFHDQWERGQPVMVSAVSNAMNMELWMPESFGRDFGEEENDLINCLNGKLVKGQKMKVFWDGFQRIGYRLLDERDRPMMLKLKDWPPGDDFAEMMPTRFNDLMKCLPLAEYTRREGRLNLASRLNSFFVRPDLGPKMYSAYGSAQHPSKGTTNLHLDVSDAVNVMVYVGIPKDVEQNRYRQKVLDAIDADECDEVTRKRIRDEGELPGALWHIYHAKDADHIRSLLNKIEVERGGSIKANHDPIHDQKWYLDANLRKRLLQDYKVEGYTIVQCAGDAIFIPAGAPHQVRNLHNCVKVAEDFVSPENISYCFKLTNEFRNLTHTHSNHEDKLQIKNIIYHTVKDAVSCLTNPLIMTKDKIDLD